MRALTKVESRNRQAKLESRTPDARAWLYDRELKARKLGADEWDRFVKAEYGQPLFPARRRR